MECQIELWVTSIDYNGDNIGRNFEFKIKPGNVNSKFSKVVKCGSWVTCNELIYKKRLLQETSVDFEILVTEKDKHLILCRDPVKAGIIGALEVVSDSREGW